jgi:hypothetical protein
MCICLRGNKYAFIYFYLFYSGTFTSVLQVQKFQMSKLVLLGEKNVMTMYPQTLVLGQGVSCIFSFR